MVEYIWNSSTQKVEEGGRIIKFEASLEYMRLPPQKNLFSLPSTGCTSPYSTVVQFEFRLHVLIFGPLVSLIQASKSSCDLLGNDP